MRAPFPYFGGKSRIAPAVWARLGEPKQYIEPFLGSAAMLLAAPRRASLEVVCDRNGFLANFWRAVKHQPGAVAHAADYPVSHIDLGARHRDLMTRAAGLGDALQDPHWPGDAEAAGWWLWGQCCWIGSGWCDWEKAIGQIPHVSNPGRGVQAIGKIPHAGNAGMLTSGGEVAVRWLSELSARLERVRIIHGDWSRCLNSNYGKGRTAAFLDPPYKKYDLYDSGRCVADEVSAWAREHPRLRVAICGHAGDYDLPGWDVMPWSRGRATYGGTGTKDSECIWFSPGCVPLAEDVASQEALFPGAA